MSDLTELKIEEIADRLKIVIKAEYEDDKGGFCVYTLYPSLGDCINDQDKIPIVLKDEYKLKNIKIELKPKHVYWR